jgi:hypothetical protein
MEKIDGYRKLIKAHLTQVHEWCARQPKPGVDALLVFDDERSVYMLVVTGWTEHERVRGATLFLRIKDGKIWLEEDWTDYAIGEKLIEEGVPKSDIVLGFQSPENRRHTEFAVA